MNWEVFWNEKAAATEPAAQVGRINTSASDNLYEQIAAHIAENLQLQPTDRLLDICCGNGQITALLAKYCALTVGTDLSIGLIQNAKEHHSAPNVHYVRANALQLSGLGGSYHKINLYFSFQYFESFEAGMRVLSEMESLLLPGGRIFIGDTPDKRRWTKYYNTPLKWLRYMYQKAKGNEPMGKFWHPKEFESMAEKLGLEVQILAEPPYLPYALYRFDAVFTKPTH